MARDGFASRRDVPADWWTQLETHLIHDDQDWRDEAGHVFVITMIVICWSFSVRPWIDLWTSPPADPDPGLAMTFGILSFFSLVLVPFLLWGCVYRRLRWCSILGGLHALTTSGFLWPGWSTSSSESAGLVLRTVHRAVTWSAYYGMPTLLVFAAIASVVSHHFRRPDADV